MLAKILKKSFDKYYNAPIEAWQEFADLSYTVIFAKNEIMKYQDTAEKFFNFILKGSAGLFLFKKNDFVCLDFAFENSFCCDYMSLLLRKPTPIQVVSLEKSEMIRITSKNFYELVRTPIGQIINQVSSETSFIDKQQQQIELLTKSSQERYEILLNKFPGICQRVAQKHIASYLGITPQSLSRIKRELK